MQRIEVTGNLGKDAEIKNINGKQLLSFSVADSYKVGEVENTTWYDVLTDDVSMVAVLTKGKFVVVRGRLTVKTYTTQAGGQGLSHGIWASEIGFRCFSPRAAVPTAMGQAQAPQFPQQPVPAYKQFQQPNMAAAPSQAKAQTPPELPTDPSLPF